MELLLVIGFVWLVSWAVNKYRNDNAAREVAQAFKREIESKKLKARAAVESIEFGKGLALQCITASVKGLILAPNPDHRIRVRVNMWTISADGDRAPIICHIEELQDPGTRSFFFQSDPQTLPYQATELVEWNRVVAIPIDSLTFPHRGKNPLTVVVEYDSFYTDTTLATATTSLIFENPELGYIDGFRSLRKANVAAVKLAVLMSAADGHLHDAEASIIQNWVSQQLAMTSDQTAVNPIKRELNAAVAEAFDVTEESTREWMINDLTDELIELLPPKSRYGVLELLLNVAKADGVAAAEELRLVNRLSDWLELDPERFRSMRDKALPISIHDAVSRTDSAADEQILGIESTMSDAEKRKRLNKEYRRWNNRTEHANPETREQARRMLDIISRVRVRLSTESSTESS